MLHYYNIIVCICQYGMGLWWAGVRETSCLGPSIRLQHTCYLASRIGSAVLTAPDQVFQGFRNDYYTQLLFMTTVMLFTLKYKKHKN